MSADAGVQSELAAQGSAELAILPEGMTAARFAGISGGYVYLIAGIGDAYLQVNPDVAQMQADRAVCRMDTAGSYLEIIRYYAE